MNSVVLFGQVIIHECKWICWLARLMFEAHCYYRGELLRWSVTYVKDLRAVDTDICRVNKILFLTMKHHGIQEMLPGWQDRAC